MRDPFDSFAREAFEFVAAYALLREFALAAADRIYAAHEVLGRLAERRVVVLSEADYPLEG